MLLTLGSPGFIGMAMSYFSMTAHLFLNVLFVWLLLERTPRRLVAAGVGRLACAGAAQSGAALAVRAALGRLDRLAG